MSGDFCLRTPNKSSLLFLTILTTRVDMAANPRFLTYKGVTVYRELRDNHEQATTYNKTFSMDSFVNGRTFRAEGEESIKRRIDNGDLPGMDGPPDEEEGGDYTVRVSRTVYETTLINIPDANSAEEAISQAESEADNIPSDEWDSQVIEGPSGEIID